MVCVIWISNVAAHVSEDGLYLGSRIRGGQKITVPNKTICQVDFKLRISAGAPTGTAYARIRRVSDDGIIETSGDTLDVTTLTGAWSWESFSFNSVVNEEVRILIEYSGGTASNLITPSLTAPAIIGVYTHYIAVYTDYAEYDCAIKIYEEAVGGWTGKISGVVNPAKVMGVNVANIASVKGVA